MTSPSVSASVLVSASIPDDQRWDGEYDAYAITDAVVAATRAVLTGGLQVLTAAHPTIAPLILQVADSFPSRPDEETRVVLYQSRLFEEEIPEATLEMMSRPYVRVEWTDAVGGETTAPDRRGRSLELMRSQMLTNESVLAAIFVGGMQGIADEFEMVGALEPRARRYAVGTAGGEAARLPNPDALAEVLARSDLYPWLMAQVVEDARR